MKSGKKSKRKQSGYRGIIRWSIIFVLFILYVLFEVRKTPENTESESSCNVDRRGNAPLTTAVSSQSVGVL